MARRGVRKEAKGLVGLLVAAIGLGVMTWGVGKVQTLIKSRAQFQLGDTWVVGNFGDRGITRTSFAINESAGNYVAARMSSGFYDKASNKTVLVYSGGAMSANPDISARNPYITFFDHTNKTWETAVQIANVDSGIEPDGHNYPTVVVDKEGYIHVFYSFHISTPIAQYKSTKKITESGVLSSFVKQGIVGTDNQPLCEIADSTYAVPFVDTQGDIYVFFRSTAFDNVNFTYPGVPGPTADHEGYFYNFEAYIKSSDNGRTWTNIKRVIDPGMPSVYVGKSVQYYKSPGVIDTACKRIWSDAPEGTAINDGQYTMIYNWEFEPDVARNGVHLGFSPTHSGAKLLNEQLHTVFFSFDNDHVYAPTGADLGETANLAEYENAANKTGVWPQKTTINLSELGGNVLSVAITAGDPAGGQTVYYTMPADVNNLTGLSYLWRAVWNGSDWIRTNMSLAYPAAFEDIPEINDAEYRASTGADLYIRHKSKFNDYKPYNQCLGLPIPAYQCGGAASNTTSENIQKMFMVHNSQSNWNGVRIFGVSESHGSLVNQDHRWWAVGGASWLQKIYNANAEMRAFMIVPKFDCNYRVTHKGDSCSNKPFSGTAVGALYVIGDRTIDKSIVPQPLSCTSWTNMSFNGCNTATKYFAGDASCTMTGSSVPVSLSVGGASATNTKMRFVKVPVATVCNDPGIWTSPNLYTPSDWVNYSANYSTGMQFTSGENKICGQVTNGGYTVVCGAIIKLVTNAIALPTVTPTAKPTPTRVPPTPTPTPIPQPISCTSWTSIYFNSCIGYPMYSANSPYCTTTQSTATVTNIVSGATRVKYKEAPVSVACTSVDFSGVAWENYSRARTWSFSAGAGEKKICAQFGNSVYSAICGSIIRKQ